MDQVGKRAPNLELSDETRMADCYLDGSGVLWDLADDKAVRAVAPGRDERVCT